MEEMIEMEIVREKEMAGRREDIPSSTQPKRKTKKKEKEEPNREQR